MPHTRLVIFDLDDTLLDDSFSMNSGLQKLQERYNLQHIPFDSFYERHQAIIEELSPRLFNGEIDGQQARVLRFGQLLSEYNVTHPDGWEASAIYRAAYIASWKLCDGALDMLQTLKQQGHRLALLSNYVRQVQMEKLERFGIVDVFEELFFVEDIPAPKPDSRAFITVCQKLNATPQQTVMVGDSFKNDVQGALNAGFQAVWYNRKTSVSDAPLSVPTIRHLNELPELLQVLL